MSEYKNKNKDEFPNTALIIGPEGGIDIEDVEELVREGAVAVTVGSRILRTETAGPAAIAMLFYEFEL